MLNSSFADLGSVPFPEFQARQKYMHAFDMADPHMPSGFCDYEPMVRQIMSRLEHCGTAYMTVDEKIVRAGWSQRRPGAHVDGQFMPLENVWGGHPSPGWAHGCNRVPLDRMSVVVVSSVPGCTAYAGQFGGVPKEDGDLEHIRSQLGAGILLPAGRAFRLSRDCVHESMRFKAATQRSFLRIALPVEE